LRKPFHERGGELRLVRVHGHELATAADDRIRHAVDVIVVHADHAEADRRGRPGPGEKDGGAGHAGEKLTTIDAMLHGVLPGERRQPCGVHVRPMLTGTA
jgi:hypothetical protein